MAALPDPANPAVIPILATAGGIIAATASRLRGEDQEQIREAAELGAYWGGVVGVVMYAGTLILDLVVL